MKRIVMVRAKFDGVTDWYLLSDLKVRGCVAVTYNADGPYSRVDFSG